MVSGMPTAPSDWSRSTLDLAIKGRKEIRWETDIGSHWATAYALFTNSRSHFSNSSAPRRAGGRVRTQ